MVRALNQRKFHKKPLKKRRFSKRIKFIRNFLSKKQFVRTQAQSALSDSEKTIKFKNNTDLDISIINWSKIFLHKYSFNGKFVHYFFGIVKKLFFKKNEFVAWILYIEYIIENINNSNDIFDEEILFYLGLIAKETLGVEIKENYEHIINKEKMSKIENICKKKKINIVDLNEKYNFFSKSVQQDEKKFYDINLMIEFIYDSNKTLVNKIIKEVEKERKAANEINDSNMDKSNTHKIENRPVNFEEDLISAGGENDWTPEDIFNIPVDGINYYDNQKIVEDNEPMKLDSSYENFNMNVNNLFYVQNK